VTPVANSAIAFRKSAGSGAPASEGVRPVSAVSAGSAGICSPRGSVRDAVTVRRRPVQHQHVQQQCPI